MPAELTPAQRLGNAPIQADIGLPAINVKAPSISAVARAIATNLPPSAGLFRRGDTYLTIELIKEKQPDGTYRRKTAVREMTPNRLCSWLEKYVAFRNGADDDAKCTSLGKQMAEKILAADAFRDTIRELQEIAHVRLPIWKTQPDGSRKIELAKPGYNPEQKLYVSPELEYDTDEAQKYGPRVVQNVWINLVKEFPFIAESPQEEQQTWRYSSIERSGPHPCTNRSACCALALLLGQYTRYLHDRAPMVIVNGNQPGTGKTLLAWMALAVTWGEISTTDKPRDDEEMTKVLNMAAIESWPYILFDDIASVASQSLNQFATSPIRRGRQLGTGKSFSVRTKCQVVATGNGLTCTADIVRRALIVDLWCATDATRRTLTNPTTTEKFSTPAWRASMLTLCWIMVRTWILNGCPITEKPSAKPSFESFATIIGSIMRANGFGSPFRTRQADVAGGDMIGSATQKLIIHIAYMQRTEKREREHTYTVREILEFSDVLGYTETICRDKNPSVAMGKQLSKYRGRSYMDQDGYAFYFGRNEDAESSKYTISLVEPDKKSPL